MTSSAEQRTPQRTLIRNGWIVPMTGAAPRRADLLIEDDRITRIAAGIDDADAAVIPADDCIVLPGFIDTHRHLWQSTLRHLACDWTLPEYFTTLRNVFGPRFTPDDIYIGTLLGALEALDAGVTTVVDFSHNLSTPDDADAALAAHVEAGTRGLLAYGGSNDQARVRDDSRHTRDAERLHDRVPTGHRDRVSIAMALRGPEFSLLDATIDDWRLARELGMPITVHVGGGLRGAGGTIHVLDENSLLGEDVLFVHCNMLSDDELRRIAETGGRVSTSPEVEANMGHGPPVVRRLREHRIPAGISVDVCTNVGGDLFAPMRAALALQRGHDHAEALARGEALGTVTLGVRDVLEMTTVDAARACWQHDRIGTLAPGKLADIVLLRADRLNVLPGNDPVAATVSACDVSNVDTVLVGGRVVKRDGCLLGVDFDRLRELANASRDRLQGASAGNRAASTRVRV
ncbi:amidohydrolase family protein [Streptomyces sp. NPDC007162]|uniref:amidohydrolase family protein n=1 Tax=Streptomyces sp. NPDC007162 TaxID=3156917 RepID=UPI0033C9774A